MKQENFKFSEYALCCWLGQLGSSPKKQLDFVDLTPPDDYGIDCSHLVKLENNRYAVITERGCSCYEYSDADIKTFDSKAEAKKYFDELAKR